MTAPEKVANLIASFEADPNATRIKKLVYCACFERWLTDTDQLDAFPWVELLNSLVERAPDLDHLQNALIIVVAHLNKKNAYFILARSLFNRLKILYPDYRSDMTSMGDRFAQVRQLLNDSQDLFSLRLRVSRHSSLSQAKNIVFSAINCRFNYTTQDLNYLNHQDFDDLVRELLYACNSIEDLRFRIFGAAHCLENRDSNLKIATLLCGTIASFYPALYEHRILQQNLSNAEKNHDHPTKTSPKSNALVNSALDPLDIGDSGLVSFNFIDLDDDLTLANSTNSGVITALDSSVNPNYPTSGLSKTTVTVHADISLDVKQDVQDFVNHRQQLLVATLENNLKAISEYIDHHAGIHPRSEKKHDYKYQVLKAWMKMLQGSCQAQLDRLEALEANHQAKKQKQI